MKLEFGNAWSKKLAKRVNGYEFEVGVLDEKTYKNPVTTGLFEAPQLRTYAGGPVRKTSREDSGKTVGDVLVANMKRLNINLLSRPFDDSNDDLIKFMNNFLAFAAESKRVSIRRIENLLQAVVRNPILREEYGKNAASTADMKGFDRHLFDTGQMFRAIKARAKRV